MICFDVQYQGWMSVSDHNIHCTSLSLKSGSDLTESISVRKTSGEKYGSERAAVF